MKSLKEQYPYRDLKERYTTLMCDRISVCQIDLSRTEQELIDHSFDIVESKVKEIKELNDTVRDLTIKIRNMEAASDDREY